LIKSKIYPIPQGGLDSFCGAYAICNAYQIIKNVSDDELDDLFNEIVWYLKKKNKLDTILLGGMYQHEMADILKHVVKNKFIEVLNHFQWTNYTLDDFWNFSQEYLDKPKTALILSLGGAESHYTAVERMTDKTMFLVDGAIKRIRKSQCVFYDYKGRDKYVLHANGSFFVRG